MKRNRVKRKETEESRSKKVSLHKPRRLLRGTLPSVLGAK